MFTIFTVHKQTFALWQHIQECSKSIPVSPRQGGVRIVLTKNPLRKNETRGPTLSLIFVIFRDAANAAFRVRAIRRNPKGVDTGKVGGQACLSPPILLCIANLRQQI